MLCRNSTGNRLCWSQLHIWHSGLFLEPFDLSLAISALVMFHAFVVIFGSEAQDSVNQPRQIMGHGGDRFGCAQPAPESPIFGPQGGVAVMQALGSQS